jgi:hypothetical protein
VADLELTRLDDSKENKNEPRLALWYQENQRVQIKTIDLKFVDLFYEKKFRENMIRDYGDELGKIIEEYAYSFNPSIFDVDKARIKLQFSEKNKTPQQNLFFYRLEKLILLYQYWFKHEKWRDPVVAVPQGYRDDNIKYHTHPGKDRVGIMKHLGIKQYDFLVIPKHMIVEENLEELKQYWGEHQTRLTLRQEPLTKSHRTLLNKDNVENILKYTETKKWLKSSLDLISFCKSNNRSLALDKMINKRKGT